MLERTGSYPPYKAQSEGVKSKRALLALDYEQILEIANVFYHMNVKLASRPRMFGGTRLSERERIVHKSVHDAAVNCCISLEEAERAGEGGKSE